MQRGQEIQEPFRKIALRIKIRRSGVYRHDGVRKGHRPKRWIRPGSSGCHGAWSVLSAANSNQGRLADKQGNWMPNAAGMHASKPLACNKIARPRKTPPNTAEKLGPRVENFAPPRPEFSSLRVPVQQAEHLFNLHAPFTVLTPLLARSCSIF